MTQKSLIKIQILPLKKIKNLQKPSRNLSNRTKLKIFGKIFLDISQKKFGSAYAQSPRKCSNIEILAKIEGKEANFFRKFTKGIEGFDLVPKKNSKLSHACVPLKGVFYGFFNTSFAAPQIPLCRRIRGSNPGLLRLRH